MLSDITPVILTYNEAPNIQRTLTALTWAKRIVVVDSGSNDATQRICSEFKNVDFIQRVFDEHARQWNFAIAQSIDTGWVLALDADHVVSHNLVMELENLNPPPSTNGYWVSFIYKINGKTLSGSLYPPLISLYRTAHGHYIQDGHTQRVTIDGNTQELTAKIYHDDRKPWSRWLSSQKNYARQEAEKLANTRWQDLTWADRLRYLGLAPIIVPPYTLLVKGMIFNGWAGLIYAWQRFVAEACLQIARLK